MYLIRTDINSKIASGHMLRCLAIADELSKAGEQVMFIMADVNGQEMIKDRGYDMVCLQSEWNNLEQELSVMCNLLDQYSNVVVLLDSYYVTFPYMKRIQNKCKLVYIDDLHQFIYPCDLLINYSVAANKYYNKLDYDESKLLLGCTYVPLRDEFVDIPDRWISHNINKLLLLTGGTDPYHTSMEFIKRFIDENSRYELTIVVGMMNGDLNKIIDIATERDDIHVCINSYDMKFLMIAADFAFSAAGTTLYELCACGTPTMSYVIADNQIDNAKAFEENNLIHYIGDVREGLNWEEALRMLESERYSYEKRKNISYRMQHKVDGNGCKRIVNRIIGLNSKSRSKHE